MIKKYTIIPIIFLLSACTSFNGSDNKTKAIVDTLSDKYVQDPHYVSKIVKQEDFEVALVEAIKLYKESEETELNKSFEDWLKLHPEITDLNAAKSAYEAGMNCKKEMIK